MTKLAVTTGAIMLCKYCHCVHGFKIKSQKLVRTNWLFGPSLYPTGCCIQASVAIIKNPESHEPRKTRNPESQCSAGLSRPSPKTNRPRNAHSRKNAET